MVGFTIVLKKRKRKRFCDKREKNRKKLLYFLPVILIAILSVFAGTFLEEDKTESKKFVAEDIKVFKEINDFSAYYNPVVMNGFFQYKNGDSIENEKLVELSVWSIICTEGTDKYQVFDGELCFPQEDIEDRVKLLFSDKCTFENMSSGKIAYSEKERCYKIPTIGYSPEYSAVLKSVTAERESTKLIVGCLKNESFKQDGSGKTVIPEAEKNIIITLKKRNNSFYIEEISEEKVL